MRIEENSRMVYQDEYKPFISLDNPVIYYHTAVGEPKRYDNLF
ncbi:hypothetical protein [Clostridium sp. Marseille-Q7071]